MGIYDAGFDFQFGFDKGKWLPKIGIIIALAALIVVAYWVVANFETNPISFQFDKNPIKPGEKTQVTITLVNNSDLDAENVTLTLNAKEQTEFDIYPSNEKFKGSINLISSGTKREVTFSINPVGEVLPGTYTLVAKAVINFQLYEREVKLIVKN